MVVLKKIKSATLVEALIATVLIVVVFMIASLVINNLLLNNFSKNTHQVETRLNELQYQIQNNEIHLPYQEVYEDWEITINRETIEGIEGLAISATYKNKTLTKKRIDAKE
jgi:predicted PurR-regulated permease PerM